MGRDVKINSAPNGGYVSKKTGWNHRIMYHNSEFCIHEVYYDEHGVPDGVTENCIAPTGESFEDLILGFNLMKTALKKPILVYDNFPQEYIGHSDSDKLC